MFNNICPACSNTGIVELPSINLKICFCCHTEFDFYLKPSQKSVLIDGLIGTEPETKKHRWDYLPPI